MRIVVISPPSADPREIPAIGGFLAAGLERYHVRKPAWTERELEAWLAGLPAAWRPSLVLHGHPALAGRLGLGRHDRDGGGAAASGPGAVSRSCHDLPTLRRLLGAGGSVLFGPVFASLTKPGYGPAPDFPWDELRTILTERRAGDPGAPGRAQVLAIGGVTARGLGRCLELGFDGAAVLGAVWSEPDPARAFAAVREAAARLEGARHAA